MNVTTRYLLGIVLVPAILLVPAPGGAQPQVAYPEVKVVLENPYKPDAAFDKMNGASSTQSSAGTLGRLPR
jgi:hypothetical protein